MMKMTKNDTKIKLVELLDSFNRDLSKYAGNPKFFVVDDNIELADHLIAHGVTVQEWISFDDVKPEDGQSVLGITTEGEMEVYQFDANWQNCLCRYGGNMKVFNITHWCELPQPPKGE